MSFTHDPVPCVYSQFTGSRIRHCVVTDLYEPRSITDLDDPLSRGDPDASTPPMAPGAVPVLGHALRYKTDPPGFMVLYIPLSVPLPSSSSKQATSTFVSASHLSPSLHLYPGDMLLHCRRRKRRSLAACSGSISPAST